MWPPISSTDDDVMVTSLVTEIWWHTIPGDDDFDLWGSSTTVVFYRNWSRFLTPGFYVGDVTFGDNVNFDDVTVPSRVLTDLNWNLSNTSPQAFENSSLLCDKSVTFATYVTSQICDIDVTAGTLVTFVTNCHFSISSYLIKKVWTVTVTVRHIGILTCDLLLN